MPGLLKEGGKAASLIEEMRKKGTLPALTKNVQDIMQLTSQSETSAMELATVIMRDCGLTSNLLATANSIYYRRIYAIKTVSSAVSLLGFEKVRSLALGLSIFKEFMKTPRDQKLARLYASSYFAGSFAMSLSRQFKCSNPEEMFVAGLLSNLPLIALANSYPERFITFDQFCKGGTMTPSQACLRVFDVDYEELCRLLSESYNLQGKVAEMLTTGQKKTPDPLLALVQEAGTISNMLFGEKPGGKEGIESSNARLKAILKNEKFSVSSFINSACEEDDNITRYFHLEKDDVEMMVKVLEWGKASPVELTAKLAFGEKTEQEQRREEAPESLIGHFFTELMICHKQNVDINQVLMLAQEALYRCLTPAEVFMALLDKRTKTIVGRFYTGSNPMLDASDFRFNMIEEVSPLIDCLNTKVGGHVQIDGKGYFLPRAAQRLNLKDIIFSPIIVMDKAIGLYLVGRVTSTPFDEREQAWFEQIIQHVEKAFDRTARVGTSAGASPLNTPL